MAVNQTWSDPTATQASNGLALVTGDTLTQDSWQRTVSNIYALGGGSQHCGQLQYVGGTQIRFRAVNGGWIRIAGSLYTLSADITANNTSIYIDGTSGQNLGASTLYYVYLFNNSGTLTIDYSTTAYAIDTTAGNYGTYIKSGVASRTLIGMVRTNGSSQFVDTATQRFVLSFYNRQPRGLYNAFTTNRTTTSGTYVEINAEIQLQFLVWSGDSVFASMQAMIANSSLGANMGTAIAFDSTTVPDGQAVSANEHVATDHVVNTLAKSKNGLSEGYYYMTLLGVTSVGTLTFFYNAGTGSLAGCSIAAEVQG